MFAEKLSNPFLKSSPFLNNISHPTQSYDPPPFAPSRYKNYFTIYQQPKLNSHSNFQPAMYQTIDTSHKSQLREEGNLGQILSKNPFHRPSFGTISYSKANADLSPNKYPSNLNSPRTYSYSSDNSYNYYSKSYDIGAPVKQNNFQVSNTSYQKSMSQRKYSNYESGSSAQSVGTYINKIYQLDGDKTADNNGNNIISNPFYRKQLIQDRIYQKQAVPINSYDSAALKYSYQSEDKNDKKADFHNYLQNPPQNVKLQKINPKANTQNILYEKQKQKSVKSDNEYTRLSNPFKLKQESRNNQFKKGELNQNIIVKSLNEESKYKKYYEGYDEDKKYSFGFQNRQEQHTFNGIDNKLPGYHKYEGETQFKKNDRKEDDQHQQFDFSAPDPYDNKEKFELRSNQIVNDKKRDNQHLLKQINNQHKFDKERKNFQSEYPQKDEKHNDSVFVTLGQGRQIGNNPLERKETGKFTQSQVEEYQDPIQIESKVRGRKNIQDQQDQISKKTKIISKRKTPSFGQDQEVEGKYSLKQAVSYPSTLECNGLLFHRVQIS